MNTMHKVKSLVVNKKGQTAVEYIITAFSLFGAFLAFYALYSNMVPQQFDQGAKVILSVYDTSSN
ncbi:MAG: hypothetical protein IKN49_05770 [Elusimicrobiaceae bacterium]|nr:hypothetical protein [Elusimicrobiaceae bacterium]